jgi:hypothetical protein
MREQLLEVLHRRKTLPDGNSLCYKGEVGGHGQDVVKIPSGVIFETPVFEQWVEDSKKPKKCE